MEIVFALLLLMYLIYPFMCYPDSWFSPLSYWEGGRWCCIFGSPHDQSFNLFNDQHEFSSAVIDIYIKGYKFQSSTVVEKLSNKEFSYKKVLFALIFILMHTV